MSRIVLGALVSLAVLAVYVATLFRTVPGADSGEMIGAICSGGIIHPPGYPLYLLLGKVALLFPFGSIAARVNLLSALFTALAVFFLFLAVAGWTRNRWAGVFAAGLFAFSPIVWSYATSAEVFALNHFFVAFLLWLCVSFDEAPSLRIASIAAFAFGLSLANHHTIALVGAPLGVWMLVRGGAELRRKLAIPVVCFLAGLLPYAYLPIAAAANPPISWGDFSTFDGFLRHFLRQDYGTLKLAPGEASTPFFVALGKYFASFASEFFYLGAALAVFALVKAVLKPRSSLALAIAVSIGGYLVVFHWLANLNLEKPIYHEVVAGYWQMPNLLFAAFAGWGFALVANRFAKPTSNGNTTLQRGVITVAAFLPLFVQAALHSQEQDQSRNGVVEAYGRGILEPLPPGALLLSAGDVETNAVRYLQFCEGVRPDVLIVDRLLLGYPWNRRTLEKHVPALRLPPGRFRRKARLPPGTTVVGEYGIEELIRANLPERRVFMVRLAPDEALLRPQDFAIRPLGAIDEVALVERPFDLAAYIQTGDQVRSKLIEGLGLKGGETRAWPEGSWEHYALSKAKSYEERRGLYLLKYGIARPSERQAFAAAARVFEGIARVDPNPDEGPLYLNLGLAYRYLSEVAKTKAAWENYLAIVGATANDPTTNEVRRYLASLNKNSKGTK